MQNGRKAAKRGSFRQPCFLCRLLSRGEVLFATKLLPEDPSRLAEHTPAIEQLISLQGGDAGLAMEVAA